MSKNSRQAGARSLREAISGYSAERADKLDERARQLLARFSESPEAADAFERLELKGPRAEASLLTACIAADDVARTFREQLMKQVDALARAEQWEEAVTALRKFVAEVAEEKEPLRVGLADPDFWSFSILEPPAKASELKDVLDLVAAAIDWRRDIAKANIVLLGATRDQHTKQAAENAAICVLTRGVYDAARNPPLPPRRERPDVRDVHLREVADLAQVILETDVTIERAREARRGDRDRYLKFIGN